MSSKQKHALKPLHGQKPGGNGTRGRYRTSCGPSLPAATSGWPSVFMCPTASTSETAVASLPPSSAEVAVAEPEEVEAIDENASSTTPSRRLFRGTRNAERASYQDGKMKSWVGARLGLKGQKAYFILSVCIRPRKAGPTASVQENPEGIRNRNANPVGATEVGGLLKLF